MASTPGPLMEFLGRVAYELYLMKPLLPTYLHLLVSAIFPIYTAAHASLARPSSAAPAKKKTDHEDDEDSDDDEPSKNIETLTPSDAILFPVLAGCTLAGLYFILKLLKDPATLNYWLGIYFAGVGFFFATSFFKDALVILRSIVLPTQYSYHGKIWRVLIQDKIFFSDDKFKAVVGTSPLPGIFGKLPLPASVNNGIWAIRQIVYAKARLELNVYKILHVKLPVDILDVIGAALSIGIVGYHTFIDKPWFLTNLLGFSFCYGSLQFMTPGTSWTGTLLLSALFFYDIYFVFYTPMMVTVATKLDVPIKLLFPRPDVCVMPVGAAEGSAAMEEYLKCIAKKRTMAMLGLGDIVIPGMMLAFALRFDLYLFYQRMNSKLTSNDKMSLKSPDKPQYKSATGLWGERFWTSASLRGQDLKMKQFPKTYFNATVTGYVVGMITTVLVMQIAQHAQPALLYLVPGVLVSLWGTAFVKGDLKTLWTFSEVPEDLKGTDKKSGDKSSAGDAEKGSNAADSSTDINRGSEEAESTLEESTTSSPDDKGTDTTSKEEHDTTGTSALPNTKPGQLLSLTIDLIQQASSDVKTNGKDPSPSPLSSTQQVDQTLTKLQSQGDNSGPQSREKNGDGEPPRKRGRKV